MQVAILYKEFLLGTLSYDGKEYCYSSNLDGEKELKKCIGKYSYLLFDSDNLKSYKLFSIFAGFVEKIKCRPDLIKVCNIKKGDSDFEILCSYAKQKQMRIGYSLMLIEN